MVDTTTNFNPKFKEWDFKLVGELTILECKGQWINSKCHSDKKHLFLLECQVLESLGYRIELFSAHGSGTNQKPFQVGPYKAIHYTDINHGLHSS